MLRMKKANVEIYVNCEKSHATIYCPSLPSLRGVYQEDSGVNQTTKHMAPRILW